MVGSQDQYGEEVLKTIAEHAAAMVLPHLWKTILAIWQMARNTAGGAHHTVLSYDVSAKQMRDWARMMDIEFVHITNDTTVASREQEQFLNDLAWKLK